MKRRADSAFHLYTCDEALVPRGFSVNSLPPDFDDEPLPAWPSGIEDAMIGPFTDLPAHVRGRVARIVDGTVWVDIGSKFDSPLPLSAWSADELAPVVGQECDVWVNDDVNVDDRPLHIKRVHVCVTRPQQSQALKKLEALSIGDRFDARLARHLKDGFLVDYDGLNIFVPNAYATAEMLANPAACMDQTLNCEVVSIDDDRRNVEAKVPH
jgi:ribosomal protein S1